MSKKFNRLTRKNIRALEPGRRISEHGITCARGADGDRVYSVNVQIDGQRIHRVVGRESDGVTRTQAEDYVSKARTEAREGRLQLPKGRKTHLGFSEAADTYLARLRQSGGKNLRNKERALRLHLKPFFGQRRLDQLSDFLIERYKKTRRDAGAQTGTINNELIALSHLLTMAAQWKWLSQRPCRIKKFEDAPSTETPLTHEECDRLIQAAIADQDTYLWLFVVIAANCAMRHSEILRIRFDQIDFNRCRIHIPEAKAGERRQPITTELRDILIAERGQRDDQDGWLFPTQRPKLSRKPHRSRMDREFKRAVTRAGLNPHRVTCHTLRHTGITHLVEAGVDLPTIMEISGHKTLKMVLRYTHVAGRHIDTAMEVLARGLPAASSPASDPGKVVTPLKKR